MLLLTTAALPQLQQHHHPNLGRLITPRHFCRLADTLAAGYVVAADNDCFQGLDPAAVCAMLEAIAPWPSVASPDPRRVAVAFSTRTAVGGGALAAHPSQAALDRRAGRGRRRRRDARAVPRMAHVAVSPRKARVRSAGRRGTSRASPVGGARARRSIRRRQHPLEARARRCRARPPSPQTRTPGAHGPHLERENDPLRAARSAAPRSTARGTRGGASCCSTTVSPAPASRRSCGWCP